MDLNLKIPNFRFDLPQVVTPELHEFYQSLKSTLEQHCSNVGKQSGAYQQRKRELTYAGESGHLTKALRATNYIRPLLGLWKNDFFFKKCPPKQAIYRKIEQLILETPKKRLSRLALRECCELFFTRYDEMGDELEGYTQFLRNQLHAYSSNELLFGLDKLVSSRDKIISPHGHEWLAKHAYEEGLDLEDQAKQAGVLSLQSRFYDAAQNIFYLERIRDLLPNQEDEVLYEVRRKKVYNSPYKKGEKLGLPILRALIDTIAKYQDPAESWLKTIIAIAGDPRVPKGHLNYQNWWLHLGNKRMACMLRWLSKMDMQLFLEIMEEFSKKSGNEDMKRMFRRRKKFLEGIFATGKVEEAQLFLGWQPEIYLKSRIKDKKELPFFIKLSGTNANLTIFYFKFAGVHIVEGTHSFALSITDKIPDHCPAGKYDKSGVQSRPLGIGLQESYEEQFGYTGKFIRIVHDSRGKWLTKAYKHLQKLHIKIDPSTIMNREDYLRMIRS